MTLLVRGSMNRTEEKWDHFAKQRRTIIIDTKLWITLQHPNKIQQTSCIFATPSISNPRYMQPNAPQFWHIVFANQSKDCAAKSVLKWNTKTPRFMVFEHVQKWDSGRLYRCLVEKSSWVVCGMRAQVDLHQCDPLGQSRKVSRVCHGLWVPFDCYNSGIFRFSGLHFCWKRTTKGK